MTIFKRFALSLAILVLTLVLVSCSQQTDISDDYVMLVKNTGLRKDVFIRRYQLTGEYGTNNSFSTEMLKRYISNVLEPDYLLIQHAYDLGLANEADLKRTMKDYRVNLLADNHPITYKEMTILKDELRDFYNKKAEKYDVEILQTTSYSQADSLRSLWQQNAPLDLPKEYMESFPRHLHIPSFVFGEGLHPEIYSVLLELKEGDISEPVYAASIWNILKVNRIFENKNLPPFEEIEQSLLAQAQSYFKYYQHKKLVDSLLTAYRVSANTKLYELLIAAFKTADQNGWIDKNNIAEKTLNDTMLMFGDDSISLSDYIAALNQANQFKKLQTLSLPDLEQFTHEVSAQYCLYLDAVKKGVLEDELIQDKLQNKEHRLLLTAYLNDEIMKKIRISDQEVRSHYQENPDRWQGSFESVALNVKGDLRARKLAESKNAILAKLRKKYQIQYNEALLHTVAEDLTRIKLAASRNQ